MINKFINNVFYYFNKEAKISYSQFGEDIILKTIFDLLGINKPTYLDIGAHQPKHMSNTYLFYKLGSRGVCVEPDIELFNGYQKVRSKDVCLNIGIGTNENDEEANFFVYNGIYKGLNTFSKERAEEMGAIGNDFDRVIKIPIRNINKVIEENFSLAPNLLSIDVEGLDLPILKTLDFDKFLPDVICAEITTFDDSNNVVHNMDIISFLLSKGYYKYADTFINGIFISPQIYKNYFPKWFK